MILNQISTMFRRKYCLLLAIAYEPYKLSHHFSIRKNISYNFCINQKKKLTEVQAAQANQFIKKYHLKSQQQQNSDHKFLIKLIQELQLNIPMASSKFTIFSTFCKEYVAHYNRKNHQYYFQLRIQIQKILKNCTEWRKGKFTIRCNHQYYLEYCYILDFYHITANIQNFDNQLQQNSLYKWLSMLESIQQNLQILPFNDLCLLYMKLNSLDYRKMSKINYSFMNKLNQRFIEKKGLKINQLDILGIIKSLNKRNFFSFADKKIFQIILEDLNYRAKISNPTILQFVTTFKDLNIKAHIIKNSLNQVVDKIYSQALFIVKTDIKDQQIEQILDSKRSLQENFQLIIRKIYQKILRRFEKQIYSIKNIHLLSQVAYHFPLNHKFSTKDKNIVVSHIQQFCMNQKQSINSIFEKLLQLIKNKFFKEQIFLLNNLMESYTFKKKQLFILEYSYVNTPFPIKQLQYIVDKFKIEFNNKMISMYVEAVIIHKQRKLHENSEILDNMWKKLMKLFYSFETGFKDLNVMTKLWLFKRQDYLIEQFHNQFYQYYLNKYLQNSFDYSQLIQSKVDLFSKFAEYLLIFCRYQHNLPFQILKKISIDKFLFVICNKLKFLKNKKQVRPKIILFYLLCQKLQNKKITPKNKRISSILQMLSLYLDAVGSQSEGFMELYFEIIKLLINQLQTFEDTHIPILVYLIIKILNNYNHFIINSVYYRQLLIHLLNSPIFILQQSNYQHLRYSIVKFGLKSNLINQSHFLRINPIFFSNQEYQLYNSVFNNQKIYDLNSFNLVCYFKKKNPNSQIIIKDLNIIFQKINQSTINEISQYMIHYSFNQNEHNDKILIRICQKFNELLENIEAVNFVAIFMNIEQKLKIIDINLFQKMIINVVKKLINNLDAICLANHLFILKILHKNQFLLNCKQMIKDYRRQLWIHAKKRKDNGHIILEIMHEISKIENIFNVQDLQFVSFLGFKKPLTYLKILLLNDQQQHLLKKKAEQIGSLFTKSTQNSIYTKYFSLKYKINFPLQSQNVRYLKQPNILTLNFFRSLQSAKIKIQFSSNYGYIYRLNDTISICFTEQKNTNELKFISKFIKLVTYYPDAMILSSNLGKCQLIELLHKINETLGWKLHPQKLSEIEKQIFSN